MPVLIVTLLYNLLEGTILLLLYLLFFVKGLDWNRKKLAEIMAAYVVALLAAEFLNSEMIMILVVFGLMIAVNLLCTRNRIYNFFMMIPAYLFYALLSVCPEHMIRQIMNRDNVWVMGIEGLTLSSMIVDAAIFILLAWTMAKCRKMQLNMRLSGWEIAGFVLYFLFVLFDIFVIEIFKISLNEPSRILSGTIAFAFALIVFGAYWAYLFVKRRNRQLEYMTSEAERYISMQVGFLELDSENQEELRRLRHDMRSHMQVIQSLCKNGRYDAVEDYVADLSGNEALSKPLRVTGNYAADIVIATKRAKAVQKGIAFACSGDFEGLDTLPLMDVSTIFANILENAIEAAWAAYNPDIAVTGIRHKNYLTLDVSNSVDKPVVIKNNRVATTKKDRKNHGLGIENVKRAVAKHNGQCALSCDNGRFSVKVMLPIPAKQSV